MQKLFIEIPFSYLKHFFLRSMFPYRYGYRVRHWTYLDRFCKIRYTVFMNYSEFKMKYQIQLNQQQEAAVRHVQGPVLVLAVPGSGKTTVLVTRLGYMIFCCGVRPEQILTITYTRAAARDMRDRFSKLFGRELGTKLDFRTINSLSVKIIQCYEKEQNTKAFDIISENSCSRLIREIYQKITSQFATESDIKAIRTGITYIKNMNLKGAKIDSQELDDGTPIGQFYREYCQALRNLQKMDFDDQTVYAYHILERYPQILSRFHNKYHYFCVDEAQDTSKIQHMMIRLLTSADRNLFMVGDEDQSIYGFRAAYPQALMEFDQIYPDASVLRMEQNYRSTKQIVAQADRFIQQNRNRRSKHMRTENEEGQSIRQFLAANRTAQYQYVAAEGRTSQGETAVLYRDNDSAIPLIDLLNRQGTAYRCREIDDTFFTSRTVQDVVNFIRFTFNPADVDLFLQLYYKMNAGITKVQAQAAVKQSSSCGSPILEEILRLKLSDWCRRQVTYLEKNMTFLLKDSAESAINRIVNSMGYGYYLKEKHASQNKIFILKALASQEKTPQTLLQRLEQLRQIVKAGSTDSRAPLVLSTIHASKGLEYGRVILADVVDGILPSVQPKEKTDMPEKLQTTGKDATVSEDLLEEERRLFYVAMTRAKKELILIRFLDDSMPSSFADFLFPKPKVEDHRPPQYHRQETAKTVSRFYQPVRNKDVSAVAKEFYTKTRVCHKAFGHGIITDRSGDIVTIRFDDGTVKEFVLTATLQADVLHLERV